jgi:hypothetical protein
MGHTFRIKYLAKVEVEGKESNGSCDMDTNTIEIAENLLPSKERETLIHEILHQLLQTGVTVPDTLEEPLVEFLGASLAAHIEQNKGFWTYVCRDLTKK